MVARKEKSQTLEEILKNFEQAMKDLYNSNFKKAHKILTDIESSDIDRPELIEKAQSLLKLCEKKLEKGDGVKGDESAEVIYDHGVFCHNNGDFEEALELFKKSLKTAGEKLDYVYYAMAASHAAQGQNNEALKSLKEAVSLNGIYRIHAANDPDFNSLSEDENFKRLVESI